jgi:hypothetical protein
VGKRRSEKQGKNSKPDKAPKEGRRQQQSEGVANSENDPRASVDLALARLEEKTGHMVDELVGQTRRDASALSVALQDLVSEAASSSRSALDLLTDGQAKLTERFGETVAEVEGHGVAMQALFARTEDRCAEFLARLDTLVAEVGARVARLEQQLDDVVRQHKQNIDRVTAQAIEGISVLEQAVAERAEDAEVEMSRRVAFASARDARDPEELRTHADRRVEKAGDSAAVEEQTRGEFRQLVERMRADLAQDGSDAQESPLRREMIERLDDALLASASEAWQPAATVEQFVGEVQRASARIGALSVRAEAYGEIMRTRLEAIDSWFDGFVARAHGAGQLLADAPEFDELVQSHFEAGRRTAEVEARTVETFRRTTAPMGEFTAPTGAEDQLGDDESSRTGG